jgi:hypothetical protein
MDDNEQAIRKRAHEIWESEGRPEGRHQHHWQRANDEFSSGSNAINAGQKNASETTPLASSLQPGGTIPSGGPAGSGADSMSSPRKRAKS